MSVAGQLAYRGYRIGSMYPGVVKPGCDRRCQRERHAISRGEKPVEEVRSMADA